MEMIRHSEKCMIKNAKNATLIEAVIMSFADKKYLNVVINQSVKLSMIWNGQCYEGRSAGMDFESTGPKVVKSITGIRG